jgi:uncharacterized membrane protein (UPF0127 family)
MCRFFLTVLLLLLTACHQPAPETQADPIKQVGLPSASLSITTSGGTELDVTVEVANTPQARSHGLMFRRSLGDKQGMLFVFSDERIQSFWMKNTLISLDMIFIGSDLRVVGVIHRAEPKSLTPRSVDVASRYVLEVEGGFSERHGVKKGDQVTFHGVHR